MARVLSDELLAEIDKACERVPNRLAALIPSLHLVQAEFGHVSPEAAEGGLIGLLADGDRIRISLGDHVLEALLSDEEIEARRQAQPAFEPRIETGYLSRYSRQVQNAGTGAILK